MADPIENISAWLAKQPRKSRASAYADKKEELLRYLQNAPLCGDDFCDDCGDCLSCYSDGWGDHTHTWVVYTDWLTDDEREQMAAELSKEVGYPVTIGKDTGAWRT